ncbi:MAG: Uncharacterized protein G01um101438_770 [Parcubacteria group bacterium Gr01-1014_38]|nr:MAG: Uncharacterized protein G01um101438_770 [Parcubacteria group bacterium Gr01-1014_38]
MATVKIPEKEYKRLARQARAFRLFAAHVFASVLRDPAEEVVEDFRATGKYAPKFLVDLEDGLRKSSFSSRRGLAATDAKRRGVAATAKRS